ncbi:2-oxoacid:acceptor oxidoreductase family protein [bacterium]|nr:2-oxoacid:acceptor oxidoreductase family protein [bacterium]
MIKHKIGILLSGFGGQGIVLAGQILGQAGVVSGLQAAQSSSYGSEARGSACKSEVILSPNPIIYPRVLKPDILYVMSQQGYDRFAPSVAENGRIYYDDSMVKPGDSSGVKKFGIPAIETATNEIGRKIVGNIIFLGAIVKHTGILDIEALDEALKQSLPEKIIDMNIRALRLGYMLADNLG